ncbi:MAG: DUF4129 domain-containing transglutaminase family protein, partial [Planctomycetota bacterium]
PIRLRGGVLDVFDVDRSWRATATQATRVVTSPSRWTPLAEDAAGLSGPSLTQIVQPATRQTLLLSMSVPLAIWTDEPEPVAYNQHTHHLLRARASRSSYRVAASPVPSDSVLRSLRGDALKIVERDHLRGLRNPRVAALARTVLEEEGVPVDPPVASAGRYRWNRAAAAAFTRYLHGGRFAYTTDLSDVVARPDEDLIERFFFDTRRGHCEYFASALASLCANVGVPVRLVIGYVAYEYDSSAEAYVVVESNAHAWAEVRTGALRWTEFDPTPPATLRDLHDVRATLADRLSWFYQRFEGSWNSAVVAYDGGAQQQLAQSLDRRWTDRMAGFVQSVRDWMIQVNRSFYFGPAGYIWMGVVAFAGLLALLVAWRVMWRSRALQRQLRLRGLSARDRQRMIRRLGFYLDMLRILEAAGVPKPAWRPPLRHASTIQTRRPEAAELVRRITAAFYRVRYGGEVLSRDRLRQVTEMVEQLPGLLREKR